MWRTVQNLMTVAAVVACGGLTLRAAWVAGHASDDPRAAERAALLERLTSGDLNDEPADECRRWVRQFERDVRQKYDWASQFARLTDAEQQYFVDNFAILSRQWLAAKVDSYHQREARRRPWYLRREVENLQAWPTFSSRSVEKARRRPPPPGSGFARVAAAGREWYAAGDERRAERWDEFVAAVETARTREAFRGFWPWAGGGDRPEPAPQRGER